MALLLAGCNKEPLEPPAPVPAERVLLMYDNIENDNGVWFARNVTAAGKAVAEGALDPAERVVVFDRRYRVDGQTGNRSVVYELVKDSSQPQGYRLEMLRVYGQGENDDLSPEVIAAVVGDIRRAVPADHYGFAFGSHGKGWVSKLNPVNIMRKGGGQSYRPPFAELWTVPENSLTRFFQGYGQKLDVSEFIDALDEWKWDFILLDDCFMAAVETMYEMRDLAKYIIASPTEIIIDGFPYYDVVSILFTDWENNLEASVTGIADAFVEAYRADVMHPGLPHATIAVVKASEMDALAESVRRLNLGLNELTSVDGIQYYERYTSPGHVFFDLDDYLIRIRKDRMPVEYNAFLAQLERAVVFKDYTEYFYSDSRFDEGTVRVDHYSGLNVFIPWNETAPLFSDYRQTAWYRAVYAE